MPHSARKKLPVFLRSAEAERLAAATSCARDRLIVLTGLLTGLRVSELTKLRIEDVDFEEGQVFVNQGKGRRDRFVPLPSKVAGPLQAWLAGRTSGFVFQSRNGGGRLASRTVQTMIKATAERASIPRRVTPHVLRHSYATRLLDTGSNLREVQELLGHSSVATTEIYTHVSLGRLKAAAERL